MVRISRALLYTLRIYIASIVKHRNRTVLMRKTDIILVTDLGQSPECH